VKSTDLAGRSILVVEDEPLIRFDLTMRLEAAGATVVAASHLTDAIDMADHRALSAGVLDFDLGSADTTPVCWRLVDRRIPFVFHTGQVYSAFQQWPLAPIILKPSGHGLIATVAALLR
jgi:CheY-like chemotaxis protein